MSESHFDEYEHYDFDQDKFIFAGHSASSGRSREVSEHTNHHDPNGHARKLVTKMVNTERNPQELGWRQDPNPAKRSLYTSCGVRR
uniref:Putative dna-binding nuclear protein p8 n=1 Tax=Ixodes ricinus TaxID=34613 RepID=A0A090XCK4_IXORI